MMRTLFLQAPSFDGFDGGAGSRYQARREIRSFWYPTWLAQPAALVEGRERQKRARDTVRTQQRTRAAGVLRHHRVALTQNMQRAQRDVLEVANWRRHDGKDAARGSAVSRHPSIVPRPRALLPHG